MSKPNIIGPSVVRYCDKYLTDNDKPPSITEVIEHLKSLNLKFKDSSIVSMFSTWRSANGYKQKRGRKPATALNNPTIPSELDPPVPSVVKCPIQPQHINVRKKMFIGRGKRWEVIGINEHANIIALKSTLAGGLVFETNYRKALDNGYRIVEGEVV
jgi:hypothetical protein